MYKIGENGMVMCPYNRSHVVSKLRIQKHIIKCKDRYPEVKLTTCFYNYTHRLRPEDVLKHYEICSQKIRMEEARYCEINSNMSCNSSLINDKSAYDSEDNGTESILNDFDANSVANSVKSDNNNLVFKAIPFQTIRSKIHSVDGVDNDVNDEDDLKPLNLPKTLSKAFTNVERQTEKPSSPVPAKESGFCKSKGFGRGKNFVIGPLRTQRTNDHLLPDVSDMDNFLPKKNKPKYFLKNVTTSDVGNSCSASVISSLFDDGTTLKSDDITFDEDDNNDGFIFRNFDKYVKI